jgi:hypothetical protein
VTVLYVGQFFRSICVAFIGGVYATSNYFISLRYACALPLHLVSILLKYAHCLLFDCTIQLAIVLPVLLLLMQCSKPMSLIVLVHFFGASMCTFVCLHILMFSRYFRRNNAFILVFIIVSVMLAIVLVDSRLV